MACRKKAKQRKQRQIAISWEGIRGFLGFKPVYEEVARTAQDGDILVEIGNFHGKSLAFLLEALKGKSVEVFGIDIGIGGAAQWRIDPKLRRGCTSGNLVQNLHSCALLDKVTLIIRDSAKAAKLFADNSVQFLMVDGDHSYDGVLRDLRAWWPKMKVGGLMSGDDYHRYDTVAAAVHDFFGIKSAQDPRSHETWSVVKMADSSTPAFKLVTPG